MGDWDVVSVKNPEVSDPWKVVAKNGKTPSDWDVVSVKSKTSVVLPALKKTFDFITGGLPGMAVKAGIAGAKVINKASEATEPIREKIIQKGVDVLGPGVPTKVPTREEIYKKAEVTGKPDYFNIFKRTSAETVGELVTPTLKEVAMGGGLLGVGKIMKAPKAITALVPEETEKRATTAIQRVMEALGKAKPIRGAQEALYARARAQQAVKLTEIGQNVPGEAGFHAQLSSLKGALPKVQFEPIKPNLSQTDLDDLFGTIEINKIITPHEKIAAKTGLAKLFDGGLPVKSELKLLRNVFKDDFVNAVLEKRTDLQKFMAGAGNVLNLPRSIMATADLSAPFRQGAFLIGRPKQWIPAFRGMFKYAWDEKAYTGLMDNIQARPTYQAMRESGLSISDLGPDLTSREEAFMSNIAEKIPVFGRLARGSNRAYSGFLNKLRADVFDDLLLKAQKVGALERNPAIGKDIARFVNSATGRGDLGPLGQSAVVLNNVFFSPKLMASRINLLNPKYYVGLDPFVRKEALKSLFAFASTGATIATLAKMGGLDVGINPLSSDFGKIKVGNTRYDPWGGFQQYVVLASRLRANKMVSSTTGKEYRFGEGFKSTTRWDILGKFFEYKTSPVASFAIGLMKGKDALGRDFDIPKEVGKRFVPMIAQDVTDLIKEGGLESIPMAIPAVFGVGVQTYSGGFPGFKKRPERMTH